jgi:hypothetical protein
MHGAYIYHRVAAYGDAPDDRGIGRAEGHPHFTRWGHPSAHQPVSSKRRTEMGRGDRAVTKPGGQGSSQHQHPSITHCTWPYHGRYDHGTSIGATTSYSKVRLREESVKYSIAWGFFGTTGARGVQAQKAVYSSNPLRKNLRTSHPLFTAP